MQTPRPGIAHILNTLPRVAATYLLAGAGSAATALRPALRTAHAAADPNPASRGAAVYVSYNRWSLVSDYVVDQVAALAQAGRRVVFVTHSSRLAEADAARLRPHTAEILHRRNVGHDFGAYKDGIARLGDLAALDSLILMNDSCYGPFGGLARVEQAARESGADLFGITDSWDIRYHLQTYFVWVGPRALRSPSFTKFWRTLLPSQPRSLVIALGEVRLTQALLRAGLTARAMCPYDRAAEHAQAAARRRLADDTLLEAERSYLAGLAEAVLAGTMLNPTHSFWDVLLTECGSPFVKRELLRRNPVRIPGVAGWERVLGGQPGVVLEAMRDDLKLW